jgi:hypothetical protein
MVINKTKSGILPINGSAFRVGEVVDGYPVVASYRYLGLMLNGRLDLTEHKKLINRKAGFICHKLYGLRKRDDLRINVNLFKVFIMPSYRLAWTLYSRQSEEEKQSLLRHLRVWCKRFAMIPINTAGHTFDLIFGDIQGEIEKSLIRIRRRVAIREGDPPEEGPEPAEPRKALKYLPRSLSKTLRSIYGSRCREHAMECVTTTHLRVAHGKHINLPELLRDCQDKANRRWAKLDLKRTWEYCLEIRVVRGARLGRPVGRRVASGQSARASGRQSRRA